MAPSKVINTNCGISGGVRPLGGRSLRQTQSGWRQAVKLQNSFWNPEVQFHGVSVVGTTVGPLVTLELGVLGSGVVTFETGVVTGTVVVAFCATVDASSLAGSGIAESVAGSGMAESVIGSGMFELACAST